MQLGLPSADRDYKPGHERVLKLISALKEAGFTFFRPAMRIRVAGTNGKGSTSNFLAAALQVNGLKVGLYTSPHIQTFHERIRVQGVPIEDSDLVALMAAVMPLALRCQASYFETATVLALLHFSNQKVDVEILEAGVGAKYDATTAVAADMGLLTAVALDHQEWLGQSLAEITLDKAHVFEGCKVAISMAQTVPVSRALNALDYNIHYAAPFAKELATFGEHQRYNAGLALSAVRSMYNAKTHALSPLININKSEQAISQAQVAGRMEPVTFQGHQFWLDAAHNEHAIEKIAATVAALALPFDVIFVCTRADRDLSGCLPLLQPYAKKIVSMTGSGEYAYATVQQALTTEVAMYENGRFLVLGSFVTLGETRKWMALQASPV